MGADEQWVDPQGAVSPLLSSLTYGTWPSSQEWRQRRRMLMTFVHSSAEPGSCHLLHRLQVLLRPRHGHAAPYPYAAVIVPRWCTEITGVYKQALGELQLVQVSRDTDQEKPPLSKVRTQSQRRKGTFRSTATCSVP